MKKKVIRVLKERYRGMKENGVDNPSE